MPRSSGCREAVKKLWYECGNVSEIARKLKIKRATVYHHMNKLGIKKPIVAGSTRGIQSKQLSLPRRGQVKRYILTCAQNNTYVNDEVWQNLLVLARHYHAQVMVSPFTYNKSAYGPMEVKPGSRKKSDDQQPWYDPKLAPYFCIDRVDLAPGLVFCGEMNILPTATRPLSGFETYTARKSGIFPHVKFAMESIASAKSEPTKFNYTTGTVTQVNYIQKKAGLKAEFHHCYGALLAEVRADGTWFVRQLNADRDGRIYDLDVCVVSQKVTTGHRVKAINWGDIHAEAMDKMVCDIAWGKGGMCDTLKPEFQFFHDTVNFGRRNHHDMNNPHKRFEQYVLGMENVEAEMQLTANFLGYASREWCQGVVVDSNHDNALTRWLRECDYKKDPVNAIFFLDAQSRMYRSIRDQEDKFHLIEWALKKYGCPDDLRFLREDESFVICRDRNGGIECGMHGDLGPNGSRGTPMSLHKMGRKANTGHTHSAGIMDGLYTAGTCSLFDMKWNRGPSSWSHSEIVTYQNGKRAIITMFGGGWRA